MNILFKEIDSDKYYWHRYMPEYERLVFRKLEDAAYVLEWGVLNGASIDFLSQRFQHAKIVGLDVLDEQPEWPQRDDIEYFKVDQSDQLQVAQFFEDYNHKFNLIIDDGSHNPWDQATCLRLGFPYVCKGGFYIVEDIHSNFTHMSTFTLLHALLALQHMKEQGLNVNQVTAALITKVNAFGYLTLQMLLDLYVEIDWIHFFRRACLPLKCWRCKGTNFDYAKLVCECGADLFCTIDSMTCIIKKRMT